MLQKTEIRVASLNVNGFGSLVRDSPENKWGKMYRMMSEHRIGVLMLQETHLTGGRVSDLHRIFADRIRILHSEHPSSPTQKEGVAFVINKRIMSAKGAVLTDIIPGRAAQLALPWRGGDVRHLLCVYGPTSEGSQERRDFFSKLSREYDTRAGLAKPHVMGGDFNMVEDSMDRFPARQTSNDSSIVAFDQLKSDLGLMVVDGWRRSHPSASEYTFHRTAGNRTTMSRLDRIYVRPTMMKWMRGWKIERTGVRTDHCMISVMMTTPTAPETGKGRPTFPLHLLRNKALAAEMKARGLAAEAELREIRRVGRTEARNAQHVLQELKSDWLEAARLVEKKSTPRLLQEIKERESEVRAIGADVNATPEAKVKAIESLGKLREKRLRGQQTKSRLKHRVDGELPTKYWVRLHNEAKPRELIPFLEKEGEILPSGEQAYETDPRRMAHLARTHYDGVQRDGPEVVEQTQRERDITEVLGAIDARLTDQQHEEVSLGLTYEECSKALKCAKNGTAPGLDGIQYEVWKVIHARFIEDSRHEERTKFDVLAVLSEAFADVQAHGVAKGTHFTDGWMCPIYKDKGDLSKIVNYRPITLLNTDYKLLSKILATRLAGVATDIIHPAQAGFVPGRKLRDHTQLAQMVIDWAEIAEVNGAIVALDQEKAYDRIAHDYLWRVLEKFNIPESFTRTVKALYGDAKTSVAINGVTSEPFKIYRGVRQGDPLSCLLFDLAIEPLSNMIRSAEINGINVPECAEALRATLFADDTTVYLAERDDFRNLQAVLDKWCSAAKAKFNINKTEVIPIGSRTYRDEMALAYKTTGTWKDYPTNVRVAAQGEPVRVLGSYIGNGVNRAQVWSNKIDKIATSLEQWSKHHMTIIGKRHAVQLVIGSRSQFLADVQPMPDQAVRRLNNVIRSFFWGDRTTPPVSLNVLHLPWEKGGLGLLDLEARNEAILVMWLKEFLNLGPRRQLWAKVMDDILRRTVTKDEARRNTDLRANPLTQHWYPKMTALPRAAKEILAVAYKFGVRQEGMAFERNTMRAMPMWDHACTEKSEARRLMKASPVTNCLRTKHCLRSVGEFEAFTEPTRWPGHESNNSCACLGCESQVTEKRCAHPDKCLRWAERMLASLPGKWDPRAEHPEDWEEEPKVSWHQGEGQDATPFDRRVTTKGNIADTFRIFTEGNGRHGDAYGHRRPPPVGAVMEVATDGSCTRNGEKTAAAGAGVFVSEGDERNCAVKLPPNMAQSNQTGEITAALLAAKVDTAGDALIIETDSRTTMDALTKFRAEYEDQGFIGVRNGNLIRAAIAALRQRDTHSALRWVKGHSGHTRNEGADKLAARGAAKHTPDDVDLNIPDSLAVTGAKLSSMTQKLAYTAIRARKDRATKDRANTTKSIERIMSDLKAACNIDPTTESVWRALRKDCVAREHAQFLWRTMHDSFMVGEHWARPGMADEYRARAECRTCSEVEDMNHILFTCRANGALTVWNCMEAAWRATGKAWPGVSWGTVIGAPSVSICDLGGKRSAPAEARWTILALESAYLVWKLRCERVIQQEGAEQSCSEVVNRWRAALARRREMDYGMTSKSLAAKALTKAWVDGVWEPLSSTLGLAEPLNNVTGFSG
ncbi:hypothetical protein ACG7TL_004216 [Trametes sanguinea]